MFEWDGTKELINRQKHSVSFSQARYAFFDTSRIIFRDDDHSFKEDRFFCIGRVGNAIMTVRFTWRNGKIRIFGAGYWRKGRKLYEEKHGQIQ